MSDIVQTLDEHINDLHDKLPAIMVSAPLKRAAAQIELCDF
jgi:hypothetical protein